MIIDHRKGWSSFPFSPHLRSSRNVLIFQWNILHEMRPTVKNINEQFRSKLEIHLLISPFFRHILLAISVALFVYTPPTVNCPTIFTLPFRCTRFDEEIQKRFFFYRWSLHSRSRPTVRQVTSVLSERNVSRIYVSRWCSEGKTGHRRRCNRATCFRVDSLNSVLERAASGLVFIWCIVSSGELPAPFILFVPLLFPLIHLSEHE